MGLGSSYWSEVIEVLREIIPIYDKVKKECKFYKIIKYLESDYACYSCPDSSVGKIGFNKVDGVGMILNFRE